MGLEVLEDFVALAELPDGVQERAKVKVDLFFRLLYDRALRNAAEEQDWTDGQFPQWMRDLLGEVDFERLNVEANFRIRNLKGGALRMEQNLPATEKALSLLFHADEWEPYAAFGASPFFWDEQYPHPFEGFCMYLIRDFNYRMGLDWLRDLARYEYGQWAYQHYAAYKKLSKFSEGVLERYDGELPDTYHKPLAMKFDYDVLALSQLLQEKKLPKGIERTPTTLLLYQNAAGEVKMSRIKQRGEL
ncbi:MAG: hypothetical protein WCC10_00695 [Tumebacillaceae bacterium]